MPGLLRGVARTAAIAGTATAVSNRVSRRQAGRWAAQDERRYGTQEASPPAQPAPAAPADGPDMDSKISRLKELGALHDQGVLTDAEFEAQKAKVLA
jgi:hypothetical protein